MLSNQRKNLKTRILKGVLPLRSENEEKENGYFIFTSRIFINYTPLN